MTTIYLIRHSLPIRMDLNANKQLQNEKIPLSDEGKKRAYLISQLDELSNIDAIFSSEYERAISTAKYIGKKNNKIINIEKKLNERKIGDNTNLPKSFWLTQLEDEDAKAINGESRKEVTKRMKEFIDIILKDFEDKRVVLVSHATAITFLLMQWCQLKNAEFETKKRHLIFNNKDVINDSFNCPEIFKLDFKGYDLVDISLIRK